MKKTRVAINGLGRIGRAFLKLAIDRPEIEIVAVNDLGDEANLAYLLKYDSAYGKSGLDVKAEQGKIVVNGKSITFLQEKDPSLLPWKDLDIDVVVESTGLFTEYDKARVHIDAGAKRVVISAPAHGDPGDLGATVLMGINEDKLKTCQITSNASCTTNAASPVIQIMNETVGVEKAILSTTHAYTASQRIVDSPNPKDWREGRAAAVNIIPSSTGAAHAVAQAIPELEGKFDGIAMRVPVVTGSIADITFIAKRNTTAEEVNEIFKKAAKDKRWEGILEASDESLVSSDIIGNTHAAIIDLAMTRVVDGNLVKVLSWYDNEMGYTSTLVKHVIKLGKHI
ncbi:MAG TPA: type I glyceraldehyde-3-phosphate dehydrogenase [Candidatus Paceibacterota bacterium]